MTHTVNMTYIANTLYAAIAAHTIWKKHLHEIIETGQNESNIGQTQCELGKLLEENALELKQYEHYSKVTELHDRFHREAEYIIFLALKGQTVEAKARVEYGSDFDHISKRLVQALIDWHDIIIGKK